VGGFFQEQPLQNLTLKILIQRLQFDVHTGRPYNKLCGSGATHYGYPSRLYKYHCATWDHHKWEDKESYKEFKKKYAHPMWTKLQET
jgi:hypothetical protein